MRGKKKKKPMFTVSQNFVEKKKALILSFPVLNSLLSLLHSPDIHTFTWISLDSAKGGKDEGRDLEQEDVPCHWQAV